MMGFVFIDVDELHCPCLPKSLLETIGETQ
jgi:hypothetical protein